MILIFSYVEVFRHIVKTDGYVGLFGRGLKTRYIANGLNVSNFISKSCLKSLYLCQDSPKPYYLTNHFLFQSMLFATLWKYIMERQEKARRES